MCNIGHTREINLLEDIPCVCKRLKWDNQMKYNVCPVKFAD